MEIKKEIEWFKANLIKSQIHGRNILAKLKNWPSLSANQRRQLQMVIKEYKNGKKQMRT